MNLFPWQRNASINLYVEFSGGPSESGSIYKEIKCLLTPGVNAFQEHIWPGVNGP